MTIKACRPKFWVPLIFCFLFWVLTATAGAAQTRVLQRTFGSTTSTVPDPYPLTNPQGIAVNTDAGSASEGDVYVADAGNNRVEKFGPGGEFLLMFGANVGGPGIDTCAAVCSPGTKGHA